MRGWFGWCAAIAAALLALPGCGGGSQDTTAKFKKDFAASEVQMQNVVVDLGNILKTVATQTDAAVATEFQGLAKRWQDVLSKAQTYKPPDNLKADFNTLTAAGTRLENDLSGIVSAAQTHSQEAGRQGGANVVNDAAAVRAAAQTIQTKLGIK